MSATMGSATHDEKTLGKGKRGDENGERAVVIKFINWKGVSPTFGAIGAYGTTGLELPHNYLKARLDSNCTTNPFIFPVMEYDEKGKMKLKWCPGK